MTHLDYDNKRKEISKPLFDNNRYLKSEYFYGKEYMCPKCGQETVKLEEIVKPKSAMIWTQIGCDNCGIRLLRLSRKSALEAWVNMQFRKDTSTVK